MKRNESGFIVLAFALIGVVAVAVWVVHNL
jgi:hypothetical protein